MIETILEEEAKQVKAQPKAKAKPKSNTTKEPVIKEEEPEPIIEVEETPIYINKQMVNCTDCNLSMTQHTLTYIHKAEDVVKEHFKKKLKNNLTKK